MLVFSALWLVAADDLPEGQKVKIYIQNKIFKGELLSVTPELIVIREGEKKIVLGCPVSDTEVVKVRHRCGPIGNIFAKGRKYVFKKNTPDKIKENIVNLSHDALYGSMIPDYIKGQIKLFNQL
jgi:hypothetical protein